MAFRLAYLSLALCWLSGSVQAEDMCSYTARISAKDKLTQSGKPLMTSASRASALATLQMDRANFHRFQKRGAEDTTDCQFADVGARQKMMGYGASTVLEPRLLEKIQREEPVLTVRVYKDRLEVSEAGVTKPSTQMAKTTAAATEPPALPPAADVTPPAPSATPSASIPVPATERHLSLLEHPETARAMRTLENDKRLQLIFQQSFGVAQYAECAAMVADIEQGLAIGRYELEAKQYVSYAGVAAGMAYVRQQLSSQGAERSVLEQAVRAAQQRPSGETSFF